jgi:glycosyltransferase involved in cell wall biosynthesis
LRKRLPDHFELITPKLFIGMPVRNNASTVQEAINSLKSQNFAEWNLFISDNASTDNTLDICKAAALKDPRITVHSQSENIGAAANFEFVLKKSNAPYFMWSAGDDVWSDDALHICLRNLANERTSLSFGLVQNIAPDGRPVKTYQTLLSLASRSPTFACLKFILQPENQGKANLIYGIGTTEHFRKMLDVIKFDSWGSDMAFVVGLVGQAGVSMCDTVVLRKRLSENELRNIQTLGEETPTRICDASCPVDELNGYIDNLRKALKSTSSLRIGHAVVWVKEKSIRLSWYIKNSRFRPYIYF